MIAYQDWHRSHLELGKLPLVQLSLINITYETGRELTVHRDPCALCMAAIAHVIYPGQAHIIARNGDSPGGSATDRPT